MTNPAVGYASPVWEIYEQIKGFSSGGASVSDGGIMCFTESTSDNSSPKLIQRSSYDLPVYDGSLEMELDLLVYSQNEEKRDLTGSFMLFWNGQPFDFSLDENQSTGGVLLMDMKYFEETTAHFKAEDLPIAEGDNSICFCFFPYCSEKNVYPTAQNFIAYYVSDKAREGRSHVPATDEKELPTESIKVAGDRESAEVIELVLPSDKISCDMIGGIEEYTLHREPTFHLNMLNTENIEGPSNRSGILMFFVDGKIQPVWNGKNFACATLSSREYLKTFSIETDFQIGEQHDILMAYAELSDDKNITGDTSITTYSCCCKIAE